MFKKTVFLFILQSFLCLSAFGACPSFLPEGYTQQKKTSEQLTMVNKDKTVVLGIRCITGAEAKGMDRLKVVFEKPETKDKKYAYKEISKKKNAAFRLYVVDASEKIQVTVAAKFESEKAWKAIQEDIEKYLQKF